MEHRFIFLSLLHNWFYLEAKYHIADREFSFLQLELLATARAAPARSPFSKAREPAYRHS